MNVENAQINTRSHCGYRRQNMVSL